MVKNQANRKLVERIRTLINEESNGDYFNVMALLLEHDGFNEVAKTYRKAAQND